MTDLVINAICAVLLLFVATAIVLCVIQCPRRNLKISFLAMGFCAFCWPLAVIIYRMTNSAELALRLYNLPFPFIAFLPPAILVFCLLYYNKGKYVTKKLLILLGVIPFITTLIALVPPLHHLLRTDHVVISLSPLHMTEYTWGWWFYIHAVYSYFLMIASIILVVVQHRRQPGGYALPTGLILAGISCNIIGNLFSLNYPRAMDITMVTSGLSFFVLYIAIAINPRVEFLAIARKELFYRLTDVVFITDDQRVVVDTNAAAEAWLREIGFYGIPPFEFGQVIDCLKQYGGVIKDDLLQTGDQNVFLQSKGEPVVNTMSERLITDKKDQVIGSYVTLTDITQYNRIITQLEQFAEVDALTNLSNRRVYERSLLELDAEENLPLSVIMADVNGLKKVNDVLGHKYGDELLRVVSNTFRFICNEDATVARIGGDEFAIILPEADEGEALDTILKLREALRQEQNEFFTPNVAFGAATKTSMDQDLQALIAEADKAMYTQKENDRRGVRN